MARQAALVSTWGASIPGREAKSLEVFMDVMNFWGKQAADGRCSEPEAYFAEDGSGGFAVVKGSLDTLKEIYWSEEALDLLNRAQLIVRDLQVRTYITGEDMMNENQRFMRILDEMGYA
jgi:hypothetical protein